MTDPAFPLPRAERLEPSAEGAKPLRLVASEGLEAALAALPAPQKAWAEATGFKARLGQLCLLPGADGAPEAALFGLGDAKACARSRFDIGRAAEGLPAGLWTLEGAEDAAMAEECGLGWLLSRTRFDLYRSGGAAPESRLAAPAGVEAERLHVLADGVALTRRLIDIPANDLGPAEIEAAARALAAEHAGAQGAEVRSVVGEALLAENLPLIHAVGRAAAPGREPRLIELTWGDPAHPPVTLVGKGIAFDTGGLNLKPGSSMGLMKKDMGGAATVLGLARMIMAAGLPLRLRVLIASAENAVGSASFRPGDILRSRKGLTVEINNTDAEGRLVLADALALAAEGETPAPIYCFATLTGAARVALGPELPPFYTDDEALAADLSAAAARVRDPLWRMPFWDGYEEKIEPGIADLDNAPAGGMAGSITAALFLRRFAEGAPGFCHFDIYGWNPTSRPGRPKGGECMAARAVFETLARRAGAGAGSGARFASAAA